MKAVFAKYKFVPGSLTSSCSAVDREILEKLINSGMSFDNLFRDLVSKSKYTLDFHTTLLTGKMIVSSVFTGETIVTITRD